jgi:hypothetical protein
MMRVPKAQEWQRICNKYRETIENLLDSSGNAAVVSSSSEYVINAKEGF